MKNTIYKYFFYEFIRYFTITIFALAVIVWTVQAVNFLDLITEDGHAFSIYFFYSLLTLSKILTKLVPFCFLISIVLTILKLENDNELIALWTLGLNKIHIVNLVFRISMLVMFVQIILTSVFNPTLLNLSRTLLKNSELQFAPSLLKEKQFNDTVQNLTIFVGKKNDDGIYENILIRDEGKILSQVGTISSTIIAKSGYIDADLKQMVLKNGTIQKINPDNNIDTVKFEKTIFPLLGISTKSISAPKIQETSTLQILKCIQGKLNKVLEYSSHNCTEDKKNRKDTKIEINKRFGIPIFIPLIGLVCCFLLTTRRNNKISTTYKYIFVFIGVIILTIAEIGVRYSGISWTYTALYYLVPLGMVPIFYFILIRTFKYENSF